MITKAVYFTILLYLALTSSVLGQIGGPGMNNSVIFDKMRLHQFGALFEPSNVDEWDGQDRMIRVRGKFLASNEEKILEVLKTENFRIVDDIIFITGNGDDWWKVDGSVSSERNYERSDAGENVFLKLIILNSGERLFFIEQTGF